jgi:hypothetical protein
MSSFFIGETCIWQLTVSTWPMLPLARAKC